MVAVVAILSVTVAIAIPSFQSVMRASAHRATTRSLMNNLERIRSVAVSGQQNFAGWGTDDRTESAGLRLLSANTYLLFADKDKQSNGAASEVIIDTVTLDSAFSVSGPQPEVRFQRNGTLMSSNDIEMTVSDIVSANDQVVRIAYGGITNIIR